MQDLRDQPTAPPVTTMSAASREQTVQRLRAWARQAQSEAQYADTRTDMLKWQGQVEALGSVASFLDNQGAQLSDFLIWSQVVGDREKALANWQAQQTGPEVAFYAGQVAGYDLALTALPDVDGKIWPRRDPHVG
ncbi:MAG TPA: hypothetical protein VMV29_17915 [Ktedonobacterales bacterium]|nr:hypothetical protein [Ktedonobacterales bacterium]HUY78653.1 hypothetical protein [Ktedonobacterales bacterium]